MAVRAKPSTPVLAAGRQGAGGGPPWRRRERTFRYGYQRVLGTSLDLVVVATQERTAEAARDAALAEIDRLEPIFSRYDPGSELNRWLASSGATPVSTDLAWLLTESERWIRLTRGAFHPGSDALSHAWRAAEERGVPPDPLALERLLEPFGRPLWDLDPVALCALKRFPHGLDFNAIAKGRIVDLAAEAAAAAGAEEVLLDIGGDIRHLGTRPARIAVADPHRPADNAPPAAVVSLTGEAVATSGGAYRGFRVGGTWYSHVLDPRTGHPVRDVTSATVIAPDCATADVLATAFSVLAVDDSLALADRLRGVACLLHTASGEVRANEAFARHALVGPGRPGPRPKGPPPHAR